jgi:hypothetical protein
MSEKKTHWRELVNPNYLGAYSLTNGQDMSVTIKEVKKEVVTGTGGKKEECTIAYIEGQKPMILNNTNCKIISKLFETPYIDDWKGRSIILFRDIIDAFGEKGVECLRIRPYLPKSKPELLPNTEKWNDAINFLKGENKTIDMVLKSYSISEENKKKLLEDATASL